MSLQLGQGFKPYILNGLAQVAGLNNPMQKMFEPGYLRYLLSAPGQERRQFVELNTGTGGERFVQIKYKQRLTKGFVQDSVSCDNTNILTTAELPVDVDIKKSINLYVEERTLQKLPEEMSRRVGVGGPSPIAMELYENVQLAASGLLESLDDALLAKQVSAFGNHYNTGSNATVSINLEKNTDYNSLSNGEIKLMRDYKQAQNLGRPALIGAGLAHAYFLQQVAKSANQAGIDTKIMAGMFDFYYDEGVETQWGTNQIAMIAPNSVQLVEFYENAGIFGGVRPGASEFFTFNMPVMREGVPSTVRFDGQLRYSDCDTTITDGYYGTTIDIRRGWNFIISKQVGLFTIPDGAFRATDRLKGDRGTYRYTVTNNCTTCD